MSSTFKCWLIANFEIIFCVLTVVAGAIYYKSTEDVEIMIMFILMSILLFVFCTPSKSAGLQFVKYGVMVIAVIFFAADFGWIWIVFGIATVFSAVTAFYTFYNMDEVVSRRLIWRSSNVALFEYAWVYTLDRFCSITVTIVTCVTWLILYSDIFL